MKRIGAYALILVATVLGVSCSARQRPNPSAPLKDPAPVAAASETPPDSLDAGVALSDTAPDADTVTRDTFACGSGACRVGVDSCCGWGETAAKCVPNAPPDPPGTSQLLAGQITKCGTIGDGEMPDHIERCRSSAHCPGTDLCCDEMLFSGASAFICKPNEGSEVSCEYGEACTSDQPCRDPKMICVKEVCRKRAEVDCGGRPCDLRYSTCHAPDPTKKRLACVPDAQIAAWRAEGRPISDVGCTKPSDCRKGESCRSALGRTFCQRASDGMSAVVCNTAAECQTEPCPHAKPRCVSDPAFWHKICAC